ncbi:hypothetical protein FACS1894164_08590 [Spirochaetia bacterium]|nr:hypothetical protein FACS1894164_08590 [Spirochaetia bacterium]
MKTTEKWSKMLFTGMAAMVLAFGLVLVGCEPPDGGEPYVTSVDVLPVTATVKLGKTKEFSATVSGVNNPEKTVVWYVEGATDPDTDITINSGLLTIGNNETAETLTVVARSTVDTSKSGKSTVTVLVPPAPPGPTPLPRYVAVKNETPQIPLSSTTDGTYNYYILYIGRIDHVPIVYETARTYNGTTPITLSFSKSLVTTSSVEQSTTNTFSESVTNSASLEASIAKKVKGEFKLGLFEELEVGASNELQTSLTASMSTAVTKSYSTENTYSTSYSKVKTLEDTETYTLGEHNEPAGKYRYTLEGTVDMYLFLKLNKTNTAVIDSVTSICARPKSYSYVIDYDPDLNGEFGKNSDSELTIDPELYKTLPLPPNRTEFYWTQSRGTVRVEKYDGVLGIGAHNEKLNDVINLGSAFNYSGLKADGYTTAVITIDTDIKETNGSWVHVDILKLNGNITQKFDPDGNNATGKWKEHYINFSRSIPLDDIPNGEFTIRYSASGSGTDTYYVGASRVTVKISK